MPYRLRDAVLSPAERSFYGVLSQAVGSNVVIFAKMRLADIVQVPAKTEQWQAAFNRVSAKHVDFVLCDARSIKPLLAIELDDASHATAARHKRDVFVEEVVRVAGLPLLRVTARRSYNVADLAAQIRQELAKAA